MFVSTMLTRVELYAIYVPIFMFCDKVGGGCVAISPGSLTSPPSPLSINGEGECASLLGLIMWLRFDSPVAACGVNRGLLAGSPTGFVEG